MKRLINCLLLSALMSIFGSKALAYDIAVQNDNGVTIYYTWADEAKSQLKISPGVKGNTIHSDYSGDFVIPETVTINNGETVSVIGIDNYAFNNCSGLTSVTIPNSIKYIGNYAFYYCSGLTSVTIPNSVKNIGESAFYHCSSLTSVTIGNSVTTIGTSVFSDCTGLTSVTIGNGVTSIAYNAFYGCNDFVVKIHVSDYSSFCNNNIISVVKKIGRPISLIDSNGKEVTEYFIPDDVTSIGDNAFSNCSGLTTVTIPNSVTSIGNETFSGCSGLTTVTIPNSVTSIGDNAFAGCSGLTTVTIPNSVTSIGSETFSDCSGLTTVTIPNSVTSIGDNAFSNCSDLTTVTIPNSVTSIGNETFSGCSGLTTITVNCCPTSMGSNIFSNCPNFNEAIIDCENVSSLFSRSSIRKVSMTEKVTSIGESVFSGCSSLTSVTIGNSVTTIGKYAFSGCSYLNSVIIPNNVTTIGEYAFFGCSGLLSVIIGSGVISIGDKAFTYDSNKNSKYTNYVIPIKKTIWLTNTPPSGYKEALGAVNYVSNDQFDINNKVVYSFLSSTFVVEGVRYVPISPSERTCDAIDCIYDESAEKINIGETVTNKGITLIVKKVNPYTCYGNKYIKDVRLSLSGEIAEFAFYSCTNLNTAIISNRGDIGSYAFSDCESLSSAEILNMGNIGTQAFSNCKALETAEIGQSVTSIDNEAFNGCSKLKDVILPDAVATIGSYAFANCQAMTSVKMGNGLKTINYSAFSGCSALPSITIPPAVTNINNYAFSNCTSLKEFKIADSDKELTIGSNGNNPFFSSCPLETVYIGRNINYKTSSDYGYSPFYRNTSLKTVKITDKETEISENEFYGCTNLQSVTIGDGVTTIGNWAFSGCQSLKYFAFGSQVQTIGQEAFSDCSAVVEISSKAATPPTCGSQALDDINKWECKLFVPEGCMATYQDADQWKDFFFTDEGEGTSGQNPDNPSIDNPDGRKCEAPTISIVGGKIKFDCNTNGVLFHYNITCLDVKGGVINTSEVDIQKTYRISVYASKDGYDDSSTTTKDIKMISDGDLNDDGVINVADVVELTNIIMDQEQ